MKQSQKIVKNALSGVLAEIIGGLLQLAVIILVARSIGVSVFGTFSFIVAFSSTFQLLADFGLTNILIREIATKRSDLPHLLSAARGLIWAVSAGVALLMVAIIMVMQLTVSVKILLLIMGVATLVLFHCAGFRAVFRATEDMEFNALGYVLHKVVLMALVIIALKGETGLLGIVLAHLASNLFLLAFYYILVWYRYTRPRVIVDLALWKSLIKEAVPLGGGIIVRQAAWQTDILLLTWLAGVGAVGLFSGPYRIVMALKLLPMILALSLFPMYARMGQESIHRFRTAYERSFKFFCILSFPIATTFIIWPEPILRILLGTEYLPSVAAFQVLGLAFIPIFASSLLPFLFTALGLQRLFLITATAGFVIRVLLNVLLIPAYNYIGSCVAIAISESIVLGIGIVGLWHSGIPLPLLRLLWRPILGSILMGSVLYYFNAVSLLVAVPVFVMAFALYAGVLIALRAFSSEELRLAKEGIGFLKPYMMQRGQTVDR